MHTFWLRSVPAEDSGIPAKPGSNPVSPARGTVKSGLALTRIRQVVAITAGEDLTPIKNGNATPTSVVRTNEPGTLATQMTRRPVQVDRVSFVHPVLTIGTPPIAQYDMVRVYSHDDACSGLPFTFPMRYKTLVRHQTTIALHSAHIDAQIIAGRALRSGPPAAECAHLRTAQRISKSYVNTIITMTSIVLMNSDTFGARIV